MRVSQSAQGPALRRGRPTRGAVRDEPEDEASLRAQAGRGKGGVEVVVLTMPEICDAIEAIYMLAMTVRLIPEIGDYDAAQRRSASSSASAPPS
jgi:hypothetical protein